MNQTKELDLRDWFAGQVLNGILSNPNYPAHSSGEPFDQYAARVTDSAYRIAEAMIKYGQRANKLANNGRMDGSALDGLR